MEVGILGKANFIQKVGEVVQWCLVLRCISGKLYALWHDTCKVHHACGVIMAWCSDVWLLIHHAQYIMPHQMVYLHGILHHIK